MRKEPGKSKLEPFPNMFSSYDKDGNKRITYDEFQTTLSGVKEKTALRQMFDSIDKNGKPVMLSQQKQENEIYIVQTLFFLVNNSSTSQNNSLERLC
jgi:Ca2+-binding EF-hand superfamily protein